MADSGATVNILNEIDNHGIQPKPTLLETSTRVYPYMSSTPLDLIGKFDAIVTSDHGKSKETFHVAKGPSSSILSWKTSQKLHFIKVAQAAYTTSPAYSDSKTPVQKMLDDFKNVTTGMGGLQRRICKDPHQ